MTTNTNDALPDAVRVPLDSLHADAAYLIGRLQRGTMTASRVVEVIRERIDAAKAALTTAAGAVKESLTAAHALPPGIVRDDTVHGEMYYTAAQVRAMLAQAAPAPADSVTAPAGGADWQDISTAPNDGTRFVAVGQNYGLDSEAQHTCIAQWLAGCWVEVSDWNGASKLKYLTHWMPLPPLPCSAARDPAESVTAAAVGVVAGMSETVPFSDKSKAPPLEKALRYLKAMGDQRTNSAYFFDDGYPRRESAQDALATLAVLEQLAPTPPAQTADSVLEDAARRTTKQEHAIRQGHEIAASDGYFEARPQIDSNDRRKVFQAGFERGWDAARKQGANHD